MVYVVRVVCVGGWRMCGVCRWCLCVVCECGVCVCGVLVSVISVVCVCMRACVRGSV